MEGVGDVEGGDEGVDRRRRWPSEVMTMKCTDLPSGEELLDDEDELTMSFWRWTTMKVGDAEDGGRRKG